MGRLRNFIFNFTERVVRNFTPELRIDKKSFRYLLWKRAVESSVEFVEKSMPFAVALETKEGLHEYAFQHAPEGGLVLEFGVRNGTSINVIARQTNKTVHGFDSFEGLPNDGVIPNSSMGNAKWYAGKMHMHGELPEVPENVILHKGWFDDTLPGFLEETQDPVAYMHIDCDIYSSTKTVLECTQTHLQAGTVIVFDEYLNYEGWQNNEHRAFVEFIQTSGISFKYIAYNYNGSVAVQITEDIVR